MTPVARYSLLVFVLLAAPWALAGDGRVSRPVDVDYFDRIEVGGAVRVTIEQGRAASVRVTAAESAMLRVRIERSGETLRLSREGDGWNWFKPWTWRDNRDVLFEVRLPTLKALKVTGASDVHLADIHSADMQLTVSGASAVQARKIVSDDIRAEVFGAADVAIEALEAGEVEWRLSGSSDTDIATLHARVLKVRAAGASGFTVSHSGSAGHLDVDVTGAADYRGRKLQADHVTARADGASRAEVHAGESLRAESSGAAHIDYSGRPQRLETGASGVTAAR